MVKLRRQTCLEGFRAPSTAALNARADTNGMTCSGDRGIYEHCVCTHFESLSGVTRRTDACIDHNGNGSLPDDDFDLATGFEPSVLPMGDPNGMTVAVPAS